MVLTRDTVSPQGEREYWVAHQAPLDFCLKTGSSEDAIENFPNISKNMVPLLEPQSMMPSPDVDLYLYRHAEGIHNLSMYPEKPKDISEKTNSIRWLLYNVSGDLIPDPVLTVAGMKKCDENRRRLNLDNNMKERLRSCVFAISPFKRNLQTLLLQFADVLQDAKFKYIVVDPSLQEPNGAPCNMGATTQELRELFNCCVNFEDRGENTEDIEDEHLRQAWMEAGFNPDSREDDEDEETRLKRQEALKKAWDRRGWITKEMRMRDSKTPREAGKSYLGEMILIREFRRRLKDCAGLKTFKLLTVGDDIGWEQWRGKADMVYGTDFMKYLAPYPNLCRLRFDEARKNMGTRWASYVNDWTAKEERFTGFEGNTGVVAIIHAGLVLALPKEWGMFKLPRNLGGTQSQDLLKDFTDSKGKWYELPRLKARKPYGYWQYSRGDVYKGESIIGKLQLASAQGSWKIEEDENNKQARLEQHRKMRKDAAGSNKTALNWLSDRHNELFDSFVVPVLWAACSVVAEHAERHLLEEDSSLKVKIGTLDPGDSPVDWPWVIRKGEVDHPIGYTLGAAQPDDKSLYELPGSS